jgi:hypothetical protein
MATILEVDDKAAARNHEAMLRSNQHMLNHARAQMNRSNNEDRQQHFEEIKVAGINNVFQNQELKKAIIERNIFKN